MHVQLEDRKLQAARVNYLAAVVIVLFLALAARLWYLQIAMGPALMLESETNRIKLLRTRAARGTIYDRKGRILATSRPQFVVMAIPEKVRASKEATATLCGILGLTPSELESIISKERPRPGSPVRVQVDATLETVTRIGELRMKLPGVSVELDQLRYYPDGTAVAHIMGQIGEINEKQLDEAKRLGKDYRPGDYVGKSGLEKQYEDDLRGVDGGRQIEVNAFGRVVRILGEKQSVSGHALKLNIDRDLQVAAARALGSQIGGVAAIDPQTGAVLAMVSKPDYDPNVFVKKVKPSDWRKINDNKGRPLQNRAVYNVYPPGSTFKPIMAIAGLKHNMCNVHTTVNCGGSYYLGHRFGDWKTHGRTDFMKAIAMSCDVWFYNLGHRLEIDRIAAVATQFGIGHATGIDLPYESRREDGGLGTMPSTAWKRKRYNERWWPGETISCAIGQGYIQVSPLQMAVACAAVANGGKTMKPSLVNEVLKSDGSGVLRRVDPRVVRRVDAPPEAFRLVQQGMRQTVTVGTGKAVDIEGIAVAGKTGSAEDPPRPAHGWFICFAPVENPRIAIACIVEHGRHGSSTAAPVCRAILDVFYGKKKPNEIGTTRPRVSGD